MKYYYLSKEKLINEEIQVLKATGVMLSDENADALFGVGSWLCYFGPKLPARMRYNTATNKIEVLTNDAPKKHLYAGVSLLKGVVTQADFDPSMFVHNDDLNFLVPLKFGGTPAFTYPHKSYFMTFKADGTPVSELMRVINDQYIQLTPANIDALIKRNLKVEGNISAGGTISTPNDVVGGGHSLIGTAKKVDTLEQYVYNMKDVVPPGVIAMFHTNYIPYGWTICDGRAVPAVKQTELYRKYIGNYTPDMRGYFVRGWDGGSGRNEGRGPNSVQGSSGVPPHRHFVGFSYWKDDIAVPLNNGSFDAGTGEVSQYTYRHIDGEANYDKRYTFGELSGDHNTFFTSYTIYNQSGEIRPVNISMIYAIKTHETARSITLGEFLQELYDILNIYKVNKAGDTINGHVYSYGSMTINGNLVADRIYYVAYNDYAEWFESDIKKPNYVYAFMKDDKYKLALQSDNVIAGVYSTSCIDPIGNPENAVPIALMGRVDVITDGEIDKGSLVTVSNNKPGHIVKFGGSGEIIGVALTDTKDNLTKILVI